MWRIGEGNRTTTIFCYGSSSIDLLWSSITPKTLLVHVQGLGFVEIELNAEVALHEEVGGARSILSPKASL
jgi:hypothetical protein